MSVQNRSDHTATHCRDLTALLGELAHTYRHENRTDRDEDQTARDKRRTVLQNALGAVSHRYAAVRGGEDALSSLSESILGQTELPSSGSLDWSGYPYRSEPVKAHFSFIDLFCGIGGMRLAYQLAGGRSVFSSDIDDGARATYLANYGEMPFGDIRAIPVKDIPKHDILLAGFPCQAFSMAGQRKGFDDVRGTLVFNVAEVLREKSPSAFLLENVKGLTSHDHDGFRTLDRIRDELKRAGYLMHKPEVLNARDFRVAQNRERVFIVGFRDDDDGRRALDVFAFPDALPEERPTALRLSEHLDEVVEYALSGRSVEARYFLSAQYLSTLERHKEHHRALGHGFGYHVFEEHDLATKCAHTLLLGGMGLERNLIRDRNKPIPGDRGRQGPMNDVGVRKLTPVECRRLQGFPDNFVLPGLGSARQGHLYRQFANSVAVPVIYSIAMRMTTALGFNKVTQTP